MEQLTIALAKGRLGEKALALLERCGVDGPALEEAGRKLGLQDRSGDTRFILVKPSDVPTYVERGVADIGIVGKDTLMEMSSPVYEMLDLGFGGCRLCIAGPQDALSKQEPSANLRVATKYPNVARAYYGARGVHIDIIKLNGSVELGPLVGLSDVILDIVESGRTLKENGMDVLEEVCQISARLIVNRVSLKTKGRRIKPLIEEMKKALEDTP
ncbi:MAG: ATP phosphoribosyltransferase [Eubacteriales bacterium]|nr:ATP phosphoribosyltransferase [Eubacteriales bacterium]